MTTALSPTPAQAAWIADCTARDRIARVLDGVRRDCQWPLPTVHQRVELGAALITVATSEDLGAWVAALPGPVVATPIPGGFETWTLLTTAEDWRGGPPVTIRVAALVVAGELNVASFVKLVRS